MMKVYRPLCSDVTLRLAVDISPCYDDSDEDTSADGDDDNFDGVSRGGTHQLRDSNKMATSSGTSDSTSSKNQNTKHQNSRSHNHSCSWYSRYNTPDKTAKDIYNHEHVSDASLDNIQNISLDSEFKRCVEEEGNDFKEDLRDYELVDNRWQRCRPVPDSVNENCQRRFNQYFDAELSCCIDSDAGLGYESSQTRILGHDDNSSCGQAVETVREDKLPTQLDWRSTNVSVDRNDNICPESPHFTEADQGEEDGEQHMHVYTDEVSVGSQDELTVDMDEDIDVIDKMVMRQSMTASCYGEIDDNELGGNLAQSMQVEEIPNDMTKSIAEEIHDVLIGVDDDKTDVQMARTDVHELPFSYPFTLKHVGHLFDKSRHHFTSSDTKKRENFSSASVSPPADSNSHNTNNVKIQAMFHISKMEAITTIEEDEPRKKCSVSTMTAASSVELEVTHRGLHHFIPRHHDEINIGIGDPIHVIKECDDLWCEGINLRTGERGIFPAMYANDLNFLEESDDEDEYWKFSMRFLGSVEVTSHKGDETLVHAINKVARTNKGNVNSASLSTLEINQYGIRMIDKSKEGHEKDAFSHFFALKNISFCGTHPKDNRYFAFITKHPRDYKFACHVFHGDRPTHRARDALGEAFKRFYQEYMAFTHPTEDIYME